MIHLQPASQKNQLTSSAVDRGFQPKHLLFFIFASVLIHSLGLLVFSVYHRTKPNAKEKANSKPIEFVVVPPEESEEKPPPETKKRATENSVAEKILKPEKIVNEAPSQKIVPTPSQTKSPATPQTTTETPKIVESPPETPTQPKIKSPPISESTKPSSEKQPSVLSGSDTTTIPQEKDAPVATRLAPQNKPKESIPDQPSTTPSKPAEASGSGAASLLEGDYQRTLAKGGGDAFFSPEALNYKAVLNPDQLNALKDFDLGKYMEEFEQKVDQKWNPSFSMQEYTTVLGIDVQKNGQIKGLRIIKSSGSEKVDRESIEAVQNSAPFAPLPSEFPLESLKIEFTFNIYIY